MERRSRAKRSRLVGARSRVTGSGVCRPGLCDTLTGGYSVVGTDVMSSAFDIVYIQRRSYVDM